MRVVQIFKTDSDTEFVWVRKVQIAYEITPGFNVVRTAWEIVENLFDVEPLSTHDTFDGAREYAYFYVTGKVRSSETLWEVVNM